MSATMNAPIGQAVLLPVVGETSRALDERHRRAEPPAMSPAAGRAAVKRLHEIALTCTTEFRRRGLHFEARVHEAEATAYEAAFAALTGEQIGTKR